MKRLILVAGLLGALSSAFGATTILQDTANWKDVPITVDNQTNTYTVKGEVPTDTTHYYYSYQGHRCFREKRDVAGANVLTFKSNVPNGNEIYCYPE